GGCSALVMAHAKFRVLTTRLSRIRLFFSAVHQPETLSPERWITTSKPDTSSGETSRIGSHRNSFFARAEPRTSRTTSCLPESSAGTSPDPITPEAPLIRTRAIDSNSTSPLMTWGQPPSAVLSAKADYLAHPAIIRNNQ